MSKSNGKKPVNKTDGPKKLDNKQMTKSHRSGAKDEILKEFDTYEKYNKAKTTYTKALFKKLRNKK